MTGRIGRREVLAGIAVTLAGGAAAQNPAASPPVLRALPRPTKLVGDAPESAETWFFEGHDGPPIFRLKFGEEFALTLRNDLPKPLSLHWHGVRGPNAQDGVGGLTQPAVAPGASFTYRFTPPDSGTFLVRPMVLGGAGELSGRGLGGLLVVEEREPPAVDGDHAVLVRDWRLAASGALEPFGSREEAALAGRLGNRIWAGGEAAPRRITAAPGARLRIRLANLCNARAMRIRFENARAYVAAVDGQPTDTFEPLRATLPFAPGSRYDILLDAPSEPGGRSAIVALLGQGVPLVEIVAAEGGAASAGRPAPTALPANPRLPPEIKLQNAVRRNIVITGGASRDASGAAVFPPADGPVWRVNGAAGQVSGPPLFTARRGQPVVLGIHNQTGFTQALHLHGHVFRLLHALDDGWEPYWLDTLQVPEGKTSQLAFLADNPGRWLLGSSVLERLDAGLWGWFEVA